MSPLKFPTEYVALHCIVYFVKEDKMKKDLRHKNLKYFWDSFQETQTLNRAIACEQQQIADLTIHEITSENGKQ